MPIVLSQSALLAEDSAVTLARYAARVEYPECQFWGVRDDATYQDSACQAIWSKMERDTVARYLAEAQYEIEEVCGFFLSPRWVVGLLSEQPDGIDRYTDSQNINRPGRFRTRWPRVISPGIRASTNVVLAEAVDHTADPAVVGPFATALTDVSEIHVFHPGSDVEIDPSSIVVAGGNMTIEIPRCRMVKESEANTPPNGHDYADVPGVFETTVDIKRIYNDPSQSATLVSPHRCDAFCCDNSCEEHTHAACMYLRHSIRGEIDVRRVNGLPCDCPALIRLYYYTGTRTISYQQEDAIIRLAHAKMPDEPCACDFVQRLWARDRHIPEVLDTARLNCPFGLSDGAWVAYQFALSMWRPRGHTL